MLLIAQLKNWDPKRRVLQDAVLQANMRAFSLLQHFLKEIWGNQIPMKLHIWYILIFGINEIDNECYTYTYTIFSDASNVPQRTSWTLWSRNKYTNVDDRFRMMVIDNTMYKYTCDFRRQSNKYETFWKHRYRHSFKPFWSRSTVYRILKNVMNNLWQKNCKRYP